MTFTAHYRADARGGASRARTYPVAATRRRTLAAASVQGRYRGTAARACGLACVGHGTASHGDGTATRIRRTHGRRLADRDPERGRDHRRARHRPQVVLRWRDP